MKNASIIDVRTQMYLWKEDNATLIEDFLHILNINMKGCGISAF
jgi:hypothetical protein